MTVVSIRGTHGSGKSTVVTSIMKKYGASEFKSANGKLQGYFVNLNVEQDLYIVGPYKTACGGCDAVQPYSDIWPRIEEAWDAGHHVLFEGALVSSSYGNIGRSLDEECGGEAVFAFLDTPIETCLARIAQRRAARGNFEPVKPDNTVGKFESVARTKDQMLKLGSRVRIVDIDHTQAVKQVLKLFGVNIRKEPAP